MTERKYDIAISFLSADEKIAEALYKRLSTTLSVFFFPRRQEELAGTDGLESMRVPFLDESRVVVVLYRDPWGKTPWTRVEQTAITDRCLKDGWQSLFFVVLDRTSELPVWLPHTHVRFNYEHYGLDEATGAIKARVQEHGGTIKKEDALTHARRVQSEAEYLAEKSRHFSDMRWIQEIVRPRVAGVLAQTSSLCAKAVEETTLPIRSRADQSKSIMTNGRVSLIASWSQTYSNQLSSARLIVCEFNGRLALPEERLAHPWGQPHELRRSKFMIDLSSTYDICWVQENEQTMRYTDKELADKIVHLFLDLVSRQQK